MRHVWLIVALLAGMAHAAPKEFHPTLTITGERPDETTTLDCWINSGWLHVRQRDASGSPLWHTVLCRVVDPEVVRCKLDGDVFTLEAPAGQLKAHGTWVCLKRERKPPGSQFTLEPLPAEAEEEASIESPQGYYRTLVTPRKIGYILAGPTRNINDFFGRKGIVSTDGRECANTGSKIVLQHLDLGSSFTDDGSNLYFGYQSTEFMTVERNQRDLKAPNAKAPALKISHTFRGSPKDLDLTHGLTLVDFWSTRCPPCIANAPAVEKLARAFQEKGLRTVSCHSTMLGGTVATIEAFFKKHPTVLPSVLVDRATDVAYGINSLPSYFLVKDGHIVAGPTSDVPSADQIAKLLTGQ
jgi:thiol-disulfide isomerase/thioredoxin